MGRDWLHWGRRRMSPEDTAGGCMCSVFQIFDLHPFQLPLNQHLPVNNTDLLHQEIHSSEGIEAPRNSLETQTNQEHNLNFPEGLQIKTRVSTSSKTEEICSSTSTTTTPSLVARLMGLEILPQCTSPSSSRSQFKKIQDRNILRRRSTRSFSDDDINIGIQSLPETPRLSLARRSDVECHRLSLNSANKENANEEFETGKRRGNYAKHIANQIRENSSRRVGADITNIRRDENLILTKPCKKKHESEDIIKKHKQVQVPSSGTKIARQQNQQRKKFPKKVEAFVHHSATTDFTDRNSKKAPLSVKKAPSHPPTKLPQKQIQASADALASKRNTQLCNSKKTHSYKQPVIYAAAPDSNNRYGGAAAAAVEYRCYIQRILKRTGIVTGVTSLKLGKWHTPSHPLDPSIFYYLELFHPGAVLSRRCNRKLVFQLVDELLAKILKPYFNFNPWGPDIGEQLILIDELCGKIEGFPAANCLVLEDIDGLIGKDLGNWGFGQCLEEEGAKLSREIEDEIMEWLVGETVDTLVCSSTTSVRRNNRDRRREVSRGIPRD